MAQTDVVLIVDSWVLFSLLMFSLLGEGGDARPEELLIVCVTSDMDIEAVCRSSRK